jgi:hypothetical protein
LRLYPDAGIGIVLMSNTIHYDRESIIAMIDVNLGTAHE